MPSGPNNAAFLKIYLKEIIQMHQNLHYHIYFFSQNKGRSSLKLKRSEETGRLHNEKNLKGKKTIACLGEKQLTLPWPVWLSG